MPKSVKIATSIFVALVVALALGLFFFNKGSDAPPVVDEPTTSAKPAEKTPSSEAPTPTESTPAKDANSEAPKTDEKTVGNEKSTSNDKFDEANPLNNVEAEATESFTKEEVADAISHAANYANSALTNKYYLGGQWAEDGYPMDVLHDNLRVWFLDHAVADVPTLDKDKSGSELTNALLSRTLFIADNGQISPSPECANNHGAYDSCTTPVEFSEVSYHEGIRKGVPGLEVSFSTKHDVEMTINKGNKPAYMTVEYDYTLELVPSVREDDTETFLIDGHNIQFKMSKVTERK